MPNERVRPGEIISSDLMNFILDKLDELDEAVGGLGQTNQVRITNIIPSQGRSVGEFITIEGANFLHPPGDNIIRIGGQLITEFESPSNSAVVRGRIPESLNVTSSAGEEVIVRIENSEFGSAQATYRVFPESDQPAVVITGVVNGLDSGDVLFTGSPAILTGTGFGTSAAQNSMRFEAEINGANVSHEITEKLVNTPTSIEFTVPNIPELDANESHSMNLVIDVGERSATETDLSVFQVS